MFDKKDFDDALEKFNDVQRVYPNFKSTNNYLDSIKQGQSQQHRRSRGTKTSVTKKNQSELEVNDMYILALKYYRAGNLDAAREEFLRVNAEASLITSLQTSI